MNPRIASTIFRKELVDILRDKRTLFMMIGVPILLYPALMLISLQIVLVQQQTMRDRVIRVAVEGTAKPMVAAWLQAAKNVAIADSAAPLEDLQAGHLDALVLLPDDLAARLESGAQADIRIRYDSTSYASIEAAGRAADLMLAAGEIYLKQRLRRAGLDEAYIKPLAVNRDDVAPPARSTGSIIGIILPSIMVLMVTLGAFYPAVDLTAGEKERGTFETLLSTPVTRLEIVTGKFLAVFVIALFTGLLNLASMTATFAAIVAQIAPEIEKIRPVAFDIPPAAFLFVLLILLPLGFLVSAVMMSVAVLARSFKEAQNYVTPIFLLMSIPVMAAAMPGLELKGPIAFAPLLNIILLFKELMIAKAGFAAVIPVFLSTAVWAVLALMVAAWLFQREEVILAEERGIPIGLRRSEFLPRDYPTAGLALATFCLVMLLIFYIAAFAQQRAMLPGLLLTEWLLILLPVCVMLWWARVRFRSALQLAAPPPLALAGALLAASGAIILMLAVNAWHNRILPLPEEYAQEFSKLFAVGETPQGLALLLFALAVSPAICEEVLFRGAMLSGLRQRMPAWAAVLLTAFLFGCFHLSIYRLLPTAILGMLLGYIALRSRSIFPAMAAHAINNAAAVLLAVNLVPAGLVDAQALERDGVGWPVLLAAAIVFFLGIACIEYTAARNKKAV